MIYCIVPRDLAAKLHDRLCRHYADDSSVEVVIERRGVERRRNGERRSGKKPAKPRRTERRQIRGGAGRRAGERRASLVETEPLPLPRSARRHAERLLFVERQEPTELEAEDLDTARLVTRWQAGERNLFDELYVRYFDRVFTHLKLILRDRHEAEDAAQEVFIRVFKGLPGYELRKAPFRHWLNRIVRNYSLTHLGRQVMEVEDPAEIDRLRELSAEGIDLRALDWLNDREVLMLVERMQLPQRQVIVLRYLMDFTFVEIAKILDRTPEAIRQMHSRALRLMEDRLTELGRTVSGKSDDKGGKGGKGGGGRGGQRGGSREPARKALQQARVVRSRRFALTDPN